MVTMMMKRWMGKKSWRGASKRTVTNDSDDDDDHQKAETPNNGLISALTGMEPEASSSKSPTTTTRGSNSSSKSSSVVPLQTRAVAAATAKKETKKKKKKQQRQHSFDEEEFLADAFDRNDDDPMEKRSVDDEVPVVLAAATCATPNRNAIHYHNNNNAMDSASLLSAKKQVQDLQTAITKLKERASAWEQQSIQCGRAALQEAYQHRDHRNSAAAGQHHQMTKQQLTPAVRLNLLRRKLLQINLLNAASQLETLETSKRAFEQIVVQQEKEIQSSSTDVEIQKLEEQLEHVDVVQEVLSYDLKQDLLAMDDDTVASSTVASHFSEDELIRELRELSASSPHQEEEPSNGRRGRRPPSSNDDAHHHPTKTMGVAATLF